MNFKEIVQKGLWEELEAYDTEATEEEKAAVCEVMRAANAFKAKLNEEQLRSFGDYVIAASEYLQASKKAAFEKGVKYAMRKNDK